MDIMFLHVQCECEMLKTSTKKLESHLTEMAARSEEVEGQLDEEAEKYRLLKVNRHLLSCLCYASLLSLPNRMNVTSLLSIDGKWRASCVK